MRHYFFPVGHPTSQPLYQPWIILTSFLPLPQLETTTPLRSRLPSQLEKGLSTGITTNLIILKFSGLQWVRPFFPFLYILHPSENISYPFLVLHPRHKLKYFENAGWQDEWITRAEQIVRTQFEASYGSMDTSWATSRQPEAKVCTSS